METVTLSPKFQVVIPKNIREEMKLTAGEKFHVVRHADRVELVPVRPIENMFGAFPGIEIGFEREVELVPDRSIQEMRGFLKRINTTIEEVISVTSSDLGGAE